MNVGLLTDLDVITAVLSSRKKIPLNSLEGYIRQIIGWKQSMRYLYEFHSSKFIKHALTSNAHLIGNNYLNHKNKISRRFWNATTGMPPIDECIHKVKQYAYLHHIERLMVMGNFFLITMINPDDVYNWFISIVSIDSYEWVMLPNIYGMIMYADGGFMMSRPYFSSSAYIKKMSGGYPTSANIVLNKIEYQWDTIWDALYYNFIYVHRPILKKIYAAARNVYHWDKKPQGEKEKIIKLANLYLDYLNS